MAAAGGEAARGLVSDAAAEVSFVHVFRVLVSTQSRVVVSPDHPLCMPQVCGRRQCRRGQGDIASGSAMCLACWWPAHEMGGEKREKVMESGSGGRS